MNHPSFLALDRWVLGTKSEATTGHLEQCPDCSSYIGRLQAEQTLPLPAAQTIRVPRRRLGWWGLGLSLAAAAAAIVLAVKPEQELTTAKSASPAVAVYIKRGDRVALWNGKEPLHTGDLIRLRVFASDFTQIAVTTPDQDEALYRGQIHDPRGELLPSSWRVEATGDEEKLNIFLCPKPISAEMIKTPPKACWTTSLVLPKD